MVLKCCVPNCRGNYDSENKVHVFKFPENADLKNKWLRAIKRDNFEPTKNSVVCHLHFIETDILWESKAVDSKTGKTLTAPLSKPQLKKSAVPCKLPNCPAYLSSTSTPHREAPSERKEKMEARNLEAAIDNSLKTLHEYKQKYTFGTFEELIQCLSNLSVSEKWSVIGKDNCVTLMYIDYDKIPHHILYIVINQHLNVNVFLRGYEVNNKSLPKSVFSIHEIENVMKISENFLSKEVDKQQCVDIIIKFMENLNYGDKQKTVVFLKSQLQLCVTPPERHRFDPDVLILASLLFFISPHAYKFLRSSRTIILPHPNTVKRICGAVNIDPNNENFLGYIKERIHSFQEHERDVTLMLDEIHLKPFMDYKGGNVVGMAYDTTMLATTAHVLMIQGVMSSFKEVVNILPVNKMTAEKLFEIVKNVVVGLERLKLKVICIITDNNSINKKAVSHFANPPQRSIVYPHPAQPARPLFFLIDTVHILKCIRNNWINLRNDGCTFIYPDFSNFSNINYASFSALRGLFDSESHKLLKFGYGLSVKALWPSTLEKQNVKLVVQVFGAHIANSLLELGPINNLQNYDGTAKFIDIISKWWNIVNVKTPLKGIQLREELQKPITNSPSDERKSFLKQFLSWLDHWENMKLSCGTLTKETHSALKLTTYGLVELAEYCLSELKMSYLLPGKFQTDALEARFGFYRRLSGCQYHISVRQIFEAEKKLRLSSLLELSLQQGCSNKLILSRLDGDMDEVLHNRDDDAQTAVFSHISVSEEDLRSNESELPVLTYVAGYCCYSISRKLKCDSCSEFLVINKELACGKEHSLIHTLDRGGLKYPQELPLKVVFYTFVFMQKLLTKENVDKFLKLKNQRYTAHRLISTQIMSLEDMVWEGFCTKHICKEVWEKLIWICVNILMNNYCKMVNNSTDSKTNKRKLSTISRKVSTDIKKMKNP